MIVRVQVDIKEYEVEIIDLSVRPVVAVIEGEKFEIWPEEQANNPHIDSKDLKITIHYDSNDYANNLEVPYPSIILPLTTQALKSAEHQLANGTKGSSGDGAVRSPLPGIIISVAVKPGDRVHAGQQMCVLEAMKMNNSILASHNGTVTKVNIHPGQPVRARDILIEVAGL